MKIDTHRIATWLGLLESLSLEVSGLLWERIFAESIGAEYRNTSESFGDVILQGTAWECKTKAIKTSTCPEYINCIMGRVAIRNCESYSAIELSTLILDIYNQRINEAAEKYGNVGVAMLIRGAGSFFLSLRDKLETINLADYEWSVAPAQKGIRLKGTINNVPYVYWTSSGGQLSIRLKVDTTRKLKVAPVDVTIDKLMINAG